MTEIAEALAPKTEQAQNDANINPDASTENDIKVRGQQVLELPQDLYIPPDALRVFLEAFQGPLDLLLYLIRKQNLDILDIPVATITHQYTQYVELMQDLQLELAAEYLVMAAMLAEIKSRLLLPRTETEEEEGGDPRAELVRRLQEYERFKQAAEDIEALPRLERDLFTASAEPPDLDVHRPQPKVEMLDLVSAMKAVMERARLYVDHKVEKEALSIRERMTIILDRVDADEFMEFGKLFNVEEGRMGVTVTLIAILELTRQSLLELVQAELFAPIYVKAKA